MVTLKEVYQLNERADFQYIAQELVDYYLKAYESENIQNVIKESEKRLKEFIQQTLQTT